jgi:hypothetical protein
LSDARVTIGVADAGEACVLRLDDSRKVAEAGLAFLQRESRRLGEGSPGAEGFAPRTGPGALGRSAPYRSLASATDCIPKEWKVPISFFSLVLRVDSTRPSIGARWDREQEQKKMDLSPHRPTPNRPTSNGPEPRSTKVGTFPAS